MQWWTMKNMGLALFLWLAAFSYKEALPGSRYDFPRDHFAHEDYRTEWWYYTGNVQDAKGRRRGFELVFFRQGVRRGESANESAWRMDDLYLAHAAVTRVNENQFHYAERLNRAGPGVAGISFSDRRIWNGNWQAQWKGEQQKLDVVAADFRFSLDLEPVKAFVIHGLNGVSQKAEGAGRASHYVSYPRLRVTGEVDGTGVTGEAWMDHEWFTQQLDTAQRGWDWFSAQFDDGTELMLFDLRRKDGKTDPYSSGTWIDKTGKARHLTVRDFELSPREYWVSPKNGARYPIAWRLRVPVANLDVTCRAAIPGQELATKANSYWEGAVVYSGSHTGRGYLEMTGYDKPVTFQ